MSATYKHGEHQRKRNAQRQREWRQHNPEKITSYAESGARKRAQDAWRKRNPEKVKAYSRDYAARRSADPMRRAAWNAQQNAYNAARRAAGKRYPSQGPAPAQHTPQTPEQRQRSKAADQSRRYWRNKADPAAHAEHLAKTRARRAAQRAAGKKVT